VKESGQSKREWTAPTIERVGTFGAVMRSGGSRPGTDGNGGPYKKAMA
jgi:hypothetical protein